MKRIIFIFFCLFSHYSFAENDDEWFLSLENSLTEEDKLLIQKYENKNFTHFERILALITATSPTIQKKAEERFLLNSVDDEINKINLSKSEKKFHIVDNQSFEFDLKRLDNILFGNFNIQVKDKTMIKKFRKNKDYYYDFSNNFINYYFCSIEPLKLWMFTNKPIYVNYIINLEKDKITYQLKPTKYLCEE